jgi:hypothetical protein
MGGHDVYDYNCFNNDGQYAVNAAATNGSTGGFVDAVMDYNEISNDGVSFYPDDQGCGCSGGVKFWQSVNTQFVGNYVHNNDNIAVWFDTNNTGALISGNYIANNLNEGLSYEVSYNADITNNTFVGNALSPVIGGPTNGGNMVPALYINSSGGVPDSDMSIAGSNYSGELLVTDNTFINNWDGVNIQDGPNRFCDDSALGLGSETICTLEGGSTFSQTDVAACNAEFGTRFGASTSMVGSTVDVPGLTPAVTWWTACTYQAQNVSVSGNVFSVNPATVNTLIGADDCTAASWCMRNGFIEFNGSPSPAYQSADCTASSSNAPFQCAYLAASQMQFTAHNTWTANTYYGPQSFQTWYHANSFNAVPWATWTGAATECLPSSGPNETANNCAGPFGQDAGGAYASSGGPWWTYSG